MRVLISGTLHDSPTVKTSKAGKEYCIGKIKDDSTNPATWASVVCFEEQAAILSGVKKGETLAVSGKLSVDVYTPSNGEPRANLSITADNIITMKPVKKSRPDNGNRANNQGSKSSGFDMSKFKGSAEYKPANIPPPPDGDDPF
jgi:single-stranded DNA-binding protein